jgi:hypothetical protein
MTKLIWDGKYVDGKKTAPSASPCQDVETVNESAETRNLKVPQKELVQLQPSDFGDLLALL